MTSVAVDGMSNFFSNAKKLSREGLSQLGGAADALGGAAKNAAMKLNKVRFGAATCSAGHALPRAAETGRCITLQSRTVPSVSLAHPLTFHRRGGRAQVGHHLAKSGVTGTEEGEEDEEGLELGGHLLLEVRVRIPAWGWCTVRPPHARRWPCEGAPPSQSLGGLRARVSRRW